MSYDDWKSTDTTDYGEPSEVVCAYCGEGRDGDHNECEEIETKSLECDSPDCDSYAVEMLDDGHKFCAACLPMAKRCRDEETPEGHWTWLNNSGSGR